MNEKPGLEPGFFCSTSCWRLDGLGVAPRAEDMLVVPLRMLRKAGSARWPLTPRNGADCLPICLPGIWLASAKC